eukprot:UN03152
MSFDSKKRQQRLVQREKYPAGKQPQLFQHLEVGSASVSSLIKFIEQYDPQTGACANVDGNNNNNNIPGNNSNNQNDATDAAQKAFSRLQKDAPVDVVLHPAFAQLGMDYATSTITGSSSRCIAFVAALLAFFEDDFEPVKDQLLSTYLINYINNVVRYLADCRTAPLALDNIIVRCQDIIDQACRLTALNESNIVDETTNTMRIIRRGIKEYLRELQCQHTDTIQAAQKHIKDGDVILTYGHSEAVVNALLTAREAGTTVKVVVVDSLPGLEGKKLLHTLTQHGFECDYALITSLQFIISNVTKVFLGASAILSNGALLSRSGSTLVALTAKRCNKPVLVCAESFKFIHHVFLDGICYNELAKPNHILLSQDEQHKHLESTFSSLTGEINDMYCEQAQDDKYKQLSQLNADTNSFLQQVQGGGTGGLNNSVNALNAKALTIDNWGDLPNLKLLHLRYDITPPNYISALVTNYETLPPSSASVVVREEGKKRIVLKE